MSKATDCDGENSETGTALDFARDCGYITSTEHFELTRLSNEVGKMLGSMIKAPERFLIPKPH
jgi:four helix bundle protein